MNTLLLFVAVAAASVIFADVVWHPSSPRTKGGKLIIRLDDWQASYRVRYSRAQQISSIQTLSKGLEFLGEVIPAGTAVEVADVRGMKTRIVFSYGAGWVPTHALAISL